MRTALVSPRVGTVRTAPIWRVSCKSQSHRKTLTFTTRPPPPPRLLSPRAHLCGHSWLELVSPTPSPRPSEARRRASNRHWEAGSGESHIGISRQVLIICNTFPSYIHQGQWDSIRGERFPFILNFDVHSTYITVWVSTCIKLQTDSENSSRYRNRKSPSQQQKHLTIFQRFNDTSKRFTSDSLTIYTRSRMAEFSP